MGSTVSGTPGSAYAPTVTGRTGSESTGRIQSVDLIRGVVMVLMAIDHVRVYSGLPAGGQTAGIFFTRWVTHFCAPLFVFLAGTAAFMHGRKLGDTAALSRWLAVRGILLVVLELTVIRYFWSLNLNPAEFTLAGVIWMLGWCMLLLAAMVRLSPAVIGTLGIAIMALQQEIGNIPRALPEPARDAIGPIWEFIYPIGANAPVAVLYVLVPWIGVMMSGYAFGAIMVREPAERDRLCLRIGLSATAVFLLVAGGGALAGTSAGDGGDPWYVRLLNQQKYPASQLFLLMTLGPGIALLPAAERARGWWGRAARALTVFGRVPMFYYLLHIPVIHASALLVTRLREGQVHHEWYTYAPYTSVPVESRWGLPLLYLVFALVIVALYWPCKWYAEAKARRRSAWMSYL